MPPHGGLTAFRASRPLDQPICTSQSFILDSSCETKSASETLLPIPTAAASARLSSRIPFFSRSSPHGVAGAVPLALLSPTRGPSSLSAPWSLSLDTRLRRRPPVGCERRWTGRGLLTRSTSSIRLSSSISAPSRRLSSSVPCASMAAIGGRRIPCSGQQGRAATGGGAAATSPDEQVLAGGSTTAEQWTRVKQVEQDGACGVLHGNLHNEPPTLTACRASTGQICQVQMRRLRGLLRPAGRRRPIQLLCHYPASQHLRHRSSIA